jgi:hypothetical protein
MIKGVNLSYSVSTYVTVTMNLPYTSNIADKNIPKKSIPFTIIMGNNLLN